MKANLPLTTNNLLCSKILSCQLCDLSLGRTRAVPGEGFSQAGIMLVGEAPGAEEDITGRPFVGRCGRLLDQSLAQAGIKRPDVFITSVVKCRPPKNRRPKKAETDACRSYLQSQIDTIKPRVICLMGNVATKALLNKQGVTSMRGQVFEGRFLVTYHPAAVLRNRNLQSEFISDLKKAREIGSSSD